MKAPNLIKEETVLDDFFSVDKDTFENKEGEEYTRLRVNRPDAVACLVYNVDQNSFVFVKQHRPAIRLKEDEAVAIEVPAGVIDPGEHSHYAMCREIKEEVGYEVTPERLRFVRAYYPAIGYCSEYIFLYTVAVEDKDRVNDGGGLDEENEDIEVLHLSLEDTYSFVEEGKVKDGKTIQLLLNFKNDHIAHDSDLKDDKIINLENEVRDLKIAIQLLNNKPN